MALIACEKEINIDYHGHDTRYVVEGTIDGSGTEVRVSKTNAMDDNNTVSDVNDATVKITADDGTTVYIPFSRNGYYRSKLKGVAGTTYQLDVEVDGQHFTSTSTMQSKPKMNEFRLIWKKMFTERYLFGDLRLQDISNESNWYFMHIYRNGLGYRWAVMKDDKNPNKELQQLFTFFRDGAGGTDVLHDGDQLRIVIRAIDQRAYDYLYSMQQRRLPRLLLRPQRAGVLSRVPLQRRNRRRRELKLFAAVRAVAVSFSHLLATAWTASVFRFRFRLVDDGSSYNARGYSNDGIAQQHYKCR